MSGWIRKQQYSTHVTGKVSNYDECLLQLFYQTTFDGELISKDYRTDAVNNGHAGRADGGWNFITKAGVDYLAGKELVRP